jgi:hypothetical protein
MLAQLPAIFSVPAIQTLLSNGSSLGAVLLTSDAKVADLLTMWQAAGTRFKSFRIASCAASPDF